MTANDEQKARKRAELERLAAEIAIARAHRFEAIKAELFGEAMKWAVTEIAASFAFDAVRSTPASELP